MEINTVKKGCNIKSICGDHLSFVNLQFQNLGKSKKKDIIASTMIQLFIHCTDVIIKNIDNIQNHQNVCRHVLPTTSVDSKNKGLK